MAGSDIQNFLLGALGGAGTEGAEIQKQNSAVKKQDALQRALEARAEGVDQRNGLPPSAAWRMLVGKTGLPPDTPMPADFAPGRQLSQGILSAYGREYAADQGLAGRKYGADHRPPPAQHGNPAVDEGKADALARAAAVQALGGKHGQNPDLTKITDPADVHAYNAAYMRSRGPNYKGPAPMAEVAGKPGSGLHGFLGFGSPTVPASSMLVGPGGPDQAAPPETAAGPDFSGY